MAKVSKPKPPPATLALRLSFIDPPANIQWALQIGRTGLAPPTATTASRITLDFTVEVKPGTAGNAFRLAGPVVQGRPGERFVYVNTGLYAGQPGAQAGWRAKVPLEGITAELIAAAQAKPSGRLEAHIAGTGRNGAPAHATVALLGDGWQLA